VIGMDLEKEGLTDEAVAQYQKALSIDAGHVAAHVNLGNHFRRSGDLDEALLHVGAAVSCGPTIRSYATCSGRLRAEGLYDKAIEQFEVAVRLAPGATPFRDNLDRASSLKNSRSKGRKSVIDDAGVPPGSPDQESRPRSFLGVVCAFPLLSGLSGRRHWLVTPGEQPRQSRSSRIPAACSFSE